MREQRGYVRLIIEARADYYIKGKEGSQESVILEDLSIGGIRIVTTKFLESADSLELSLKITGVEGEIKAIGQVAWQRKLSEKMYDTGIKFKEIQEEQRNKIADFIENVTGRNIERREYVRCDIDTVVAYSFIKNPEIKVSCVGVDVSTSGLKILTKEKLEKGTQLRVEFNLPNEPEKIVAKCTVVAWWEKQGENDIFETGIEFLEITQEHRAKINEYIKRALKKEE